METLHPIEPAVFYGSNEKSVVGCSELYAVKDPAVLDRPPATAYGYMVDRFNCTTTIEILHLSIEN